MSRFDLYRYDEDKILKKKEYNERDELIHSIEKVKRALNIAYDNFNAVTEPALIDAYIFELKAVQMKYTYLIQKAKELGIYAEKSTYIV